jgi:hypothetical protein
LGGIRRAGNERLRQRLVLGATAVIRHAKPGRSGASAWLPLRRSIASSRRTPRVSETRPTMISQGMRGSPCLSITYAISVRFWRQPAGQWFPRGARRRAWGG